MSALKPDLFVIGAMKAATTGMCDWLAQQPGIAMSVPKEPAVFVSDAAVAAAVPLFSQIYAGSEPSDLRAEGSTDYTKYPSIRGVPERLKANCPDARFVYVMRHPMERAISQYRFDWLRGGARASFSQLINEHAQLIDNSRYAFQLQQWLPHFDEARFLLIFAEEFGRDPSAQVSRILEFAGLPTSDEVAVPSSGRSNETALLVRRSFTRRVLRDSTLGRAVRPFVPPVVARSYQRRLQEKSQPEVTDGDVAALIKIFNADLRVLSGLTSGPLIRCDSWHEISASWTPALTSA